ncbi:YceD family protein [Inmirania thermothiophila]|uniref:Large ribosomal RNA subunit accumulation protein YceD n=1 Tax=Inmirania thermothiophila TaxID=1750597 RepID=A0A3N1Y5R7_9GAMM|nr:YceD family protein [Inmirania thermothiophila]ROR32637.1 uncharacterized protein EDC57_1843 [Inmirania thermothiophila]
MSAPLPRWIDPYELVADRARLVGRVPAASMGRLAGLVEALPEAVSVDLAFGLDAERHCTVTGRVEATVVLLCQRCLRPFEAVLASEVSLALVRDEAAAPALPERYDPLVAAGRIALGDLVEDELILALPVVARHEVCEPPVPLAGEAVSPRRANPFAVLARLRREDGESS